MESRARLLECIKHYYEDYFCFDAVYYKWCARYDIKDTTLFVCVWSAIAYTRNRQPTIFHRRISDGTGQGSDDSAHGIGRCDGVHVFDERV